MAAAAMHPAESRAMLLQYGSSCVNHSARVTAHRRVGITTEKGHQSCDFSAYTPICHFIVNITCLI